MSAAGWKIPAAGPVSYTEQQRACIQRYESDLAVQLAHKQGRLKHSLSVAATAEAMAHIYGQDPYAARVAGILHDWAKAYPVGNQQQMAEDLGIDLGVELSLVGPLLHGPIAARELPGRYPELDPAVLQAIERHTTGAIGMTALDMIVFVADGIEPRRDGVDAIAHVRTMVDKREPLEQVFWENFANGVAYVINTRRYLWPGTLEVYNHYALQRFAG